MPSFQTNREAVEHMPATATQSMTWPRANLSPLRLGWMIVTVMALFPLAWVPAIGACLPEHAPASNGDGPNLETREVGSMAASHGGYQCATIILTQRE
jgi:hypothetical protein